MASPVIAGKYILLRRLGKGGMAEVFLAKQTGLKGFEKLVVLKRILPHLASDGEFVTMFLDEARTAADLRHPNVVNVFDINRDQGTYFIAMEFLHGFDARAIIRQANVRRERIPVEHAASIGLGAAEGLSYAHEKRSISGVPLNIVHRDVSPANIIVGHNGEVKIVDFGIAKAATAMQETEVGELKGKYAYMSPEQARGEPLDPRTDLFSLGVVLWELLTQKRLFKRGNAPATLRAVLEEQVPRPREHDPSIPRAIDDVVYRALAQEPEARYPTCGAFARALEEAMAAEGLPHSPARLGTYLEDLFGEPESELSLSEQKLDDGMGETELDPSHRAPAKERSKPSVDEGTKVDRASRRSEPKSGTALSRSKAKRRSDEDRSTAPTDDDPGHDDPEEWEDTIIDPRPPSDEGGARDDEAPKTIVDEPTAPTRAPDRRPRPRPSRTPGPDAGSRRRTALIVGGTVLALLTVGGAGALIATAGGPEQGLVIVRSTPDSAAILVDGAAIGEVTPHVLRPPVGTTLSLTLAKDGYADHKQKVVVSSKEAVEIEAELTRLAVPKKSGKRPRRRRR